MSPDQQDEALDLEALAEQSDAESTGDQTQILYVEDDEGQRDLTATYLEQLDGAFDVTTAADGAAGLERLEREPWDCIVSDYQMPGADGIEFLREVRADYPNLPFFLFTGKGSEDVASDAVEAGVTSYVQKGGAEVYEQLANRIENAVDRRQSERLATVARHRLLELYEQTDGFYILDEDWRIAYWNVEIAERTGLASEAAIGESFWDLFPEARDTEVYDAFTRAVERGEPVELEIDYEPHGYWAEVRAYPVDTGLFVHSRDITEKKAREQQLEQRNRILQSFAHTVSHDLRNPLTVAEGNLRLAQETGDFDHLDQVTEAHNRMRNLIDELLRLARGEDIDRTETSIRSIAREAWATVTTDEVDMAVESEAVVEADVNQLQRLFENLFWNALEHGQAEHIRVGGLEGSGFYVEDDGVGIPKEDRERVMESGFSSDPESPGFGLSIVNGIAEMHDWTVTIARGSDGGARFEVTVDE